MRHSARRWGSSFLVSQKPLSLTVKDSSPHQHWRMRRQAWLTVIHEFTVNAQPQRVFEEFATPSGMEKCWTKQSTGDDREGDSIRLYFSPEFAWEGCGGKQKIANTSR